MYFIMDIKPLLTFIDLNFVHNNKSVNFKDETRQWVRNVRQQGQILVISLLFVKVLIFKTGFKNPR